MQIIESTEKPANAQCLDPVIIKTRVEKELLVGKNKPDIHPLIRKEVLSRYRYCLGEIDVVHFHLDGNEDSGIKGVRAICITANPFLKCS